MQGIVDSTLREGGQAPGVYFPLELKVELMARLDALGVEELELGGAGDSELPELMSKARAVAPRARMAVWSRCLPGDVALGAKLRPDVLAIALPISDLQLTQRLRRDKAWALAQIPMIVDLARSAGVGYVSLGLEDASRADRTFLRMVCAAAVTAGADRIRLADTVGICTPAAMTAMVREMKQVIGDMGGALEVGVHTHNDFGMATANAMAAVEAGAGWVDATVLGLGERAGIARLEELVGYLSLIGRHSRYEPGLLPRLCRMVATAAAMNIPANHPVVGGGRAPADDRGRMSGGGFEKWFLGGEM